MWDGFSDTFVMFDHQPIFKKSLQLINISALDLFYSLKKYDCVEFHMQPLLLNVLNIKEP